MCQRSTEARIESTRISLGYTYAAASPHFCGMEEFEVTELQAWPDDEGLMVRLGNQKWRIAGSSAMSAGRRRS
jgi:hypothetical protein